MRTRTGDRHRATPRALAALTMLTIAVVVSQASHADNQIARIDDVLSQSADAFGASVAIDGDTAVIGASLDSTVEWGTGAAYVYERAANGEWRLATKLLGSALFFYDRFGFSVDIDGDTIAIGAPFDGARFPQDGVVYVFERDAGGPGQWGETARILAEDSTSANYFGYAVDVDGDRLLVGAPWDGETVIRGGAGYVFERDRGGAENWGQVAKIRMEGVEFDDQFGSTVALDGDTALVGAWRDDGRAGSVTVFERDAGGENLWGPVTRIEDAPRSAGDGFGFSVAIQRDVAAIGAYLDAGGFGSVTLHERDAGGKDSWGLVERLVGDREGDPGLFGDSVDLELAPDGDRVFVGSPFEDPGTGLNSGVAYEFRREAEGGSFVESGRFSPDPPAFGQFGQDVAISGESLLVGAPQDDLTGAVYVYATSYAFLGPGPGTAGAVNEFEVVCATPGRRSFLAAGVSEGVTPVPRCPDAFVGIRNPVLAGSALAGADGRARIEVFVPPAFAGRTVLFQAVDIHSCRVSPLERFHFPE